MNETERNFTETNIQENNQVTNENQETNLQATAENTQQETVQDVQQDPLPEKIAAKNFKALKEKALQAERERDELLRMLQEERLKGKQPEQVEEDTDDIPDDFIEGKHIKKYVKEIRGLKKELEQLKNKTTLEITDARLKAECPDFNKVITDENVAAFKEEHPELAASILNSKADPYSVAKSLYKTMKKFGIYVEDNYVADKQIIQRNISKVKPSTSTGVRQGDTALARAGEYVAEELTPERKALLWEEVRKYSN